MSDTRVDIADALRSMAPGETRGFAEGTPRYGVVEKKGADEFRVSGSLPTSYPNTVRLLRSTVRLLRSLGIEYAN